MQPKRDERTRNTRFAVNIGELSNAQLSVRQRFSFFLLTPIKQIMNHTPAGVLEQADFYAVLKVG